MNRTQRRAQARESGKIPRHSYKLQPQICALWIPAAKGYLAEFSPSGFRVMGCAELAMLYTDDEASSAALAFHDITGLRVAVRPYYDHSTAP
jgi:hypothetical protein